MAGAYDEQLDWLHQQHEELVRQTALLEQQNRALAEQNYTLGRIARHTGLLYGLAVAALVVMALVIFIGAVSLNSNS